ncbi:MAG: thiol peroxidase [bacterium]|jgi:thiol peroxidase
MNERKGVFTAGGNPLTLLGDELKPGMTAPEFTVLDGELKPVSLSQFRGKVVLLSVVTSLDTGTCDIQTRKFNEKAASLGDDVVILTVSMDLPFAQKRWCGAAGIDKVVVLSDYRDADLGPKYGILIKELRLLARSLFVIDREGKLVYAKTNSENADEPDYEPALEAARAAVG